MIMPNNVTCKNNGKPIFIMDFKVRWGFQLAIQNVSEPLIGEGPTGEEFSLRSLGRHSDFSNSIFGGLGPEKL